MASTAKLIRAQISNSMISKESYIEAIEEEISKAVKPELDIDALVHGEPESCGSWCVNTPIMYGEVSRPKPMAVFWSKMARRIIAQPVKGMVTAPPVIILNRSVVRNDQTRFGTCHQFILATRTKVEDLEVAGVQPAFMEKT